MFNAGRTPRTRLVGVLSTLVSRKIFPVISNQAESVKSDDFKWQTISDGHCQWFLDLTLTFVVLIPMPVWRH